MNKPQWRIPWARLAIEGTVIVFSILLAFGIDTAWDERREKQADIQQLVRVVAELQTNRERVQVKVRTLENAISASSELLSWMGPEPKKADVQQFGDLFDRMIRIGTLSLTRSAVDDFLSRGRAGSRDDKLRYRLSEWESSSSEFEEYYELLRVAHANLIEYMNTKVPALHLMSKAPWMERHPRSRFPLDPGVVLTDPKGESYVGHYLIRMEIAKAEADFFEDEISKLIDLVEKEVIE